MKRLNITIATLFVALSIKVYAQTCILPAPPTPPAPDRLIVTHPKAPNLPDGGYTGCTIVSVVSGGATPTAQSVGDVKCNIATKMSMQAAAIDNGWNDGGTP